LEKPDVAKHEQFREICAAASIGQATPEELFLLEQHAQECEACQQAYFDYLNLAAGRFASAGQDPVLSAETAEDSLDSELFTQRFFERAEREGIPFSAAVGRGVRELGSGPQPSSHGKSWRVPLRAIAAVVLLGLSASGAYFYGKQVEERRLARRTPTGSGETGPIPAVDQRVTELVATNAKLESEVIRLKADLGHTGDQLQGAERDLRSTSEDRDKLAAARASLDARLNAVEAELSRSQALAASAQGEAATHRERADQIEATLVDDKVKINDLAADLEEKSAALDKERQLLALGHDVSDLMGARNLHIVDVVDTDPRGKTQPAFGRIFFTEGKSLVFYAYDLSEAKLEKANYEYRIWAKQEGTDKQVRSLGIFYSDDKAQRRWVFKCNDPKVLTVIDSVFVTLEPTDADPSHPKGPNLMYAYLRGQPNHP
jgi:hypothetical protein